MTFNTLLQFILDNIAMSNIAKDCKARKRYPRGVQKIAGRVSKIHPAKNTIIKNYSPFCIFIYQLRVRCFAIYNARRRSKYCWFVYPEKNDGCSLRDRIVRIGTKRRTFPYTTSTYKEALRTKISRIIPANCTLQALLRALSDPPMGSAHAH